MSKITVRRVERGDLEGCVALEKRCYIPIEAATRDFIKQRIEVYPDGFYLAEMDGEIVGMVNSGSTHKDDITKEEFKNLIGHVRNGRHSVVFSLAVHPDHRGEGIARMLMAKIVTVSEHKQKKNILLLCKNNLVDFYKRLGFNYGGLSSSTFGGFIWHEMQYDLSVQA